MSPPSSRSHEATWQKLMAQHDNLARKVARRMQHECPEDIQDLEQIARLGLMKACQKFDPTVEAAFSSFAVPYLRGEIQHYRRDHWPAGLKVPRRNFEAVAAAKRIQKQLAAKGREVSLERVGLAMGHDPEKWAWILESTQRGALANVDDLHHLGAEPDDSEDADRLALRQQLLSLVAGLPSLQCQCVIEHFFEQKTLDQIARKHQQSRAEVEALINLSLEALLTQLPAPQEEIG